MEGSVDENSTMSDEEYDDLAMRDGLENGYWSDDDEGPNNERKQADEKKITVDNLGTKEKYQHNLDLFSKISEHVTEPPYSYSLLSEKISDMKIRKRSLSDSMRFQGRTLSISAVGESASMYRGPVLPVAPQR